MFGWLKGWFSSMDRVTAAQERTAKASEDIAGAVESVRDQLFARLGIEAPVAVRPIAAKPDDAEHEADAPKRGRGR